jgi:hypothetical protein
MIETRRFVWLLGSGVSRKKAALIQGAEHDVESHGAEVVAEWVKTGAAKYADTPKAKKATE